MSSMSHLDEIDGIRDRIPKVVMEGTGKTSAKERDTMNANANTVPESAARSVTESETSTSDSESSDFDREYTCDVCEKSFSGMKPLKQHEKSAKHLKTLRKQKLKKDIEEGIEDDEDSDEDFSLDRSKIYAECEACCKEFNGPESYHLHIRSKRHKKKVANSKILEKSKEDGKINVDKLKQIIKVDSSALEATVGSDSDDDDTSSAVLECEACEKVFSGLEPFRDHMTSKTHKKTLKQKKMLTKLTSLDPENTIRIEDDVLACKLCRMSFSGAESAKAHLKSKGHLDWLEFKKWKKERKSSENQESGACGSDDGPSEIDTAIENAQASKSSEQKETGESQTLQARMFYKEYKDVMNKSESIK